MVSGARAWWRRNRWALLALLVLVPAALAASLSIDAFGYLASRPSVITVVERGDVATLGEARIRVLDSWSAPAESARGEQYAVPEGTALVSVTLELDAGAASEDFTCQLRLLQTNPDRRWSHGFTDTDYFPGREMPDGVPSSCVWDQRPFPFEVTFLIPEDAVDAVVLEVVTSDQLPRANHLQLR